MTKPIEPHFSKLWYVTVFGMMGMLVLPLEWAGLIWWTLFEHFLGFAALVWFLGIELAAGGVLAGYQGTMTAWTLAKIHQRWLRAAWAFVIVALMYWRLPHFAYFNWIVGTGFVAWLPKHYWGGFGPVDRFFQWLARTFHLPVRIW